MKRIIFLAALALSSLTANSQNLKKTAKKESQAKSINAPIEGAGMVFETETMDYGTIARNSNGSREFIFTNNGNKTLVIETVQSSCGCVIPTKPDHPILPGAKGVIGVKYDTQRIGRFTKTLTVKSNAVGQETKILILKGIVLPDAPVEEIPPAKN